MKLNRRFNKDNDRFWEEHFADGAGTETFHIELNAIVKYY